MKYLAEKVSIAMNVVSSVGIAILLNLGAVIPPVLFTIATGGIMFCMVLILVSTISIMKTQNEEKYNQLNNKHLVSKLHGAKTNK